MHSRSRTPTASWPHRHQPPGPTYTPTAAWTMKAWPHQPGSSAPKNNNTSCTQPRPRPCCPTCWPYGNRLWTGTNASRTSLASPTPSSIFNAADRSEEHTSELQSQSNLVCRLLLEKKKTTHVYNALQHVISTGVSPD